MKKSKLVLPALAMSAVLAAGCNSSEYNDLIKDAVETCEKSNCPEHLKVAHVGGVKAVYNSGIRTSQKLTDSASFETKVHREYGAKLGRTVIDEFHPEPVQVEKAPE